MAKAIFVDGASLSWMRSSLGINQFEFKALYQILTEIGVDKEVFGKPLYTISKTVADGLWVKSVRSRGFEVVVCETENSQDDQFIIDQIKALKPGDVSEIVLVSADQDFVPILRDKKAQGIKIYWVATRVLKEDGWSMVGVVLDELFNTEFEFVELADYKDRLMRTPWTVRTKPEPSPPQHGIKVTLSMDITHDVRLALFNDVVEIVKKYPSMKYIIEG